MRTFLKILLGFLTFAAVTLTFVSYEGNTLLTDKEKYLKNIITDDFDNAALNDVKEGILSEGDQFALEYDKLWETVDKEALIDFIHSYTTAFIDSVLNGSNFKVDYSYESEELKDGIRKQITVMGDEVGLTDEEIEEDTNSIYGYLKSDIDSSLKFIPDMVTKRIKTISGALDKARPYTVYGKWFLIATVVLTVLLAAVSMYKKGVFGGLLFVAVPFWFASALVFVPSMMFSIYDSASKLTIAESSLHYVLVGILNTVEKQLFNSSALFFAAATVLTFISAYLFIRKNKQPDDSDE